jgi:hypothetical protein
MTHIWIGRRYLPERHGQRCRLLVARRGKFLVEFADGWRVTTVRGTIRKIREVKP